VPTLTKLLDWMLSCHWGYWHAEWR